MPEGTAVKPSSVEDQLEELQVSLGAAHEVNAHLNREIERLSNRVLELEEENKGLQTRIHYVSKLLAQRQKGGSQQEQLKKSDVAATEGGAVPDNGPGHSPDENRYKNDNETTARSQHHIVSNDWPLSADSVDAAWARELALAREQGWLIDPSEVTLGEVLGKGTFGTTYRSMWRGAEVAVKAVTVGDVDARGTLLRELEALRRIRHPNVMGFYGACVVTEDPVATGNIKLDDGNGDQLTNTAGEQHLCSVWLLCELLVGGTLADWALGPPGSLRPPRRALRDRLRAVLDVARGMQALDDAQPPILHRDLKPTNVFMDAHGTAKVADMGLARVLVPGSNAVELTGETGTYSYMSPEMVRHEPYDSRSDVWSFGVMALEVLTQRRPYAGSHLTPVQVAIGVSEGALHPIIPEDLPPDLAELFFAMFAPDPAERPPFGLIVTQIAAVLESEERAANKAPAAAAREWITSRPWAARVLGGVSSQ